MGRRIREQGVSLVELVVAIVVVAVGVAGVLAAFMSAVSGSADPLLTKQWVAFAEGVMEEVLARPTNGNGVRPSATAPCPDRQGFDEVDDFAGLTLVGLCRPNGVAEPIPQAQATTTVEVSDTTLGPPGAAVAAKRVRVIVDAGNGKTVQLLAYRATGL